MLLQFNSWLDQSREITFDLIRMPLGIGLFASGILCVINADSFVSELPPDASSWIINHWVIYLMAPIYIIGGLFITLGLWTQISSLIQVPVLFGAFFYSSLLSGNQSFELYSIVLFMLLLVAVCGSGKWSMDQKIFSSHHNRPLIISKFYPYRSHAFDLLRMYLGLCLLLRGILFIADSDQFFDLIGSNTPMLLRSELLLNSVALSHIFGGFMLLAGLMTRLGALIQIPILLGAVFVEFMSRELTTQGMELAVITLFLLIIIVIHGSGAISFDHYFFRETSNDSLDSPTTIQSSESPGDDPSQAVQNSGSPIPDTLSSETSISEIIEDPNIVAQARYSIWGWILFQINVTPRPIEIVFKNVHTGSIVHRSQDPKVIQRFKYR